jgi:CYTH domain-containing protein
MDIDPKIASALGFPKLDYVAVERERRWLCREVPRELVIQTEAITDLYVTGGRLRLREARPIDGGTPRLRLSRKADADPQTRLITSIYLTEDEFAVLAASLPGARIRKLRHRLRPASGVLLAIDEFQGTHAGLLLLEAELETSEQLAAFAPPAFAGREVTDDPGFTGGHLAQKGLPPLIG